MMLKCIPTEDHLARMYYELGLLGAVCEGQRRAWPYRAKNDEELICLAAEMSRYDPRLFSIVVRFLAERWCDFNPSAIRSLYASMSTPQAIAVMVEFLLNVDVLNDEARYFFEYLQRGLKPLPLQFFFHHLYVPGGNLMQRAVETPLQEFKRWGFIAREAPILDDASRRPIGTHDAAARKNVLLRLFADRRRLKLADYLDAVGNSISRQQALIDMKSMPGIRRVGSGRGAHWEIAA